MKDFTGALGSQDWSGACEQLTEEAKFQLAASFLEDALDGDSAPLPDECEDLAKATFERLDKGVFSAKARIKSLANVEDVDVASDGDSAKVTYAASKNDQGITIEGPGTWELEEVGDEWRIDSPLPFIDD